MNHFQCLCPIVSVMCMVLRSPYEMPYSTTFYWKHINHVSFIPQEANLWKLKNMGINVSAEYPSSTTSSFPWPSLIFLMGSGKHISLWGSSCGCCCTVLGPSRQHTPCIMPPKGSTAGQVSLTSLWRQQCEGGGKLTLCFSTYADSAHCRGHMPSMWRFQWIISHNVESREVGLDSVSIE